VQSKGLEWNTVFIINANDGTSHSLGEGTPRSWGGSEGAMAAAAVERGASLEVREGTG